MAVEQWVLEEAQWVHTQAVAEWVSVQMTVCRVEVCILSNHQREDIVHTHCSYDVHLFHSHFVG